MTDWKSVVCLFLGMAVGTALGAPVVSNFFHEPVEEVIAEEHVSTDDTKEVLRVVLTSRNPPTYEFYSEGDKYAYVRHYERNRFYVDCDNGSMHDGIDGYSFEETLIDGIKYVIDNCVHNGSFNDEILKANAFIKASLSVTVEDNS